MKNRRTVKRFITAALCLLSGLAIILPSCKKEVDPFVINGAAPEPLLPAQPYSYMTGNDAMATLGRVLFYDKNLSLSNTVSCGSCHKQQFAFADNRPFSQGMANGYTARNSSAIVSDFGVFGDTRHRFWDGRAGNNDTAVFMPVMNNVEMHVFDLNILPEKLQHLSYYGPLFSDAFGDETITVARIRTALANFISSLYSVNSRLDLTQLSAFEMEGQNVFAGKGRCYNCHSGSNFNGYISTYANIGLDVNYNDAGRFNITQNEKDRGRFMVPTLRNIEVTGPYMHDGRYNTLREVIDHYDHGLQDSRNLSWHLRDVPQSALANINPNQDIDAVDFSMYPPVQMGMTEHEKQALEAYLKTLTDPQFLTDPKFSDPFVH